MRATPCAGPAGRTGRADRGHRHRARDDGGHAERGRLQDNWCGGGRSVDRSMTPALSRTIDVTPPAAEAKALTRGRPDAHLPAPARAAGPGDLRPPGPAPRSCTCQARPCIEYQLYARAARPDMFVAEAGYGHLGPEYITLDRSFVEGGYEPTEAFVLNRLLMRGGPCGRGARAALSRSKMFGRPAQGVPVVGFGGSGEANPPTATIGHSSPLSASRSAIPSVAKLLK